MLVTLAITAFGFFVRYCDRAADEASKMPVQTVLYRAADDADADEYYEGGSRHKKKKKKSRRNKSGGNVTKKSKSEKGSRTRSREIERERRDFLRDSIPVRPE